MLGVTQPLSDDQICDVICAYRDGVSAADLGRRYGRTRQAIYLLLRKNGIPRNDHSRIERKCGWCGSAILVLRNRAARARVSYCNSACYQEKIRSAEYQTWRHGQRIAHEVVSGFFALVYGNVVHHRDGDQDNNDLANLMVFATHGDLMRWHRGGGEASGVVPLWRGDRS